MSKLKDLRVILVILLVISWAGAGLGGYFYHTEKTKQLALKDEEILAMNTTLDQIGELVTAYAVSSDVVTGKKIDESDLTPIDVPISMVTNLALDPEEIIGKYFKTGLTAGTALSSDMVYADEITDDQRLLDVVVHNIPVGLKEGSFVDVRITLPKGEDFVAMAHKKVHTISGGVLKLVVTEKDIHTYNSMLIDSLIYPGTTLYAIEYLEGGIQSGADTYYPLSSNVLAIAQKDPNLLEAIKSDIVHRRDSLETGLVAIEDEELTRTLERGREKHQESITDAEREFERRMEKLAEQKAEQDRIDAQNAANSGG